MAWAASRVNPEVAGTEVPLISVLGPPQITVEHDEKRLVAGGGAGEANRSAVPPNVRRAELLL
jgi:hypothetical protein